MTTLENDILRVKIHPRGAELHSVFSSAKKNEYIWQADEKIWPRHAPLLFPFVGKLRNNRFRYQGKEYSVSQHGFARDKDFTLSEKEGNRVLFELGADEKTLEQYPFHFLLQVEYFLQVNALEITCTVLNPGNEKMYFSIGAHPGFSCKPGNLADCYLEFEKEENTQRYYVKEGLISNETENFVTEQKKFFLSDQIFMRDAIVLKNLQSHSVYLRNKKNKSCIRYSWGEEFNFFGIWSKPGTDEFVCLEPWAGIADGENFSGELEQKVGIITLGPWQRHSFKQRMEFF